MDEHLLPTLFLDLLARILHSLARLLRRIRRLVLSTYQAASGAGASMGRFQLLIFIFVIALSFFLIVISDIKVIQNRPGDRGVPTLPEVPQGVLLLLGISTSGYAVGKAIQHGSGTGTEQPGGAGQQPEAKKTP